MISDKMILSEQFHKLWAQLPGLYWVADSSLKVVAVSQEYLDFVHQTSEAVLQQSVAKLYQSAEHALPDGGLRALKQLLQDVLQTGQEKRLTTQKLDLHSTTSQEKIYNLLFRPILDQRQKVEYIIHQATEPSQQPRLLRLGEEKFQTPTRGVVMHVPPRGQIVDANSAAEKLLGLSRDELLQRDSHHPAWQVVNEAGKLLRPPHNPVLQALETGEVFRNMVVGVFHPRRKERRWLLVDAIPQFRPGEEKPFQVYTLFADITEIKLAEENMRRSEEQFRALVEASVNTVWMANAAGEVEKDSPSWRAFTGQTYEEQKGYGWLNAVHPDDRDFAGQQWREAVAREGQVDTFFRLRHLSGEWRQTAVRAVPLRNVDGSLRGYVGTGTDISQRKPAGEILQEAEIYRAIAANLPHAAVFVVDRHLRYLVAAGQALQSVGMASSDLEGRTVSEALDEELRTSYEPYYRQALAGESFHHEHLSHGRHFSTHGTPLQKNQGEVYAVLVVSYDITERKQAEKALHQSKEKIREINSLLTIATAASQLGWNTWDFKTGETHWDERGRQIIGLDENSCSAEAWLDRLDPDDRLYVENHVRECIVEGKNFDLEYRVIKPDGGVRYVHGTGTFLVAADGTPVRGTGLVRDITEQKRAEQALRESEEHLQLILKSAIDYAIFTLDQQGKITDWNSGAERILGFTKEEAIGQAGSIVFTPEDREKKEVEKELEIARETRHVANERWHVRKDGSRFWGSGYTMSLRTESGDVRGFLKIIRDATERQQTEEWLRQAKREAEEMVQAKENFLAHMSHEIRTPLNGVVGLANLLLQQNPRPTQLENLQTLKYSAENLRVLVNDILDFSKIRAGKMEIEENKVNLYEMLNSLQKTHQSYALDKGNELRFKIEDQIPAIICTDQLKLSQVLHNLLGNAMKFTRQGIIELSVSLNRQEGDPPNRRLWIDFSVSDTGIGIPESKLNTIFDAFTQANNATVRQQGGTGLGLSITKLLLELMGSGIEVESGEGVGSRFYFTLPVQESASEQSSEDEPVPALQAEDITNLKVLLVEDVAVNRMVCRQLLEDWWKLIPDEAENGQKAVAMVQKTHYDLILMDVRMPVMDGYQAAKAIRQLPIARCQHVPIMALTADTAAELNKHPEASFFTDIITKPFDPQDLQQKIIRHAPRKKAGRAPEASRPKADPEPISTTLSFQRLEEYFKGDDAGMQLFLEKVTEEFEHLQQKFNQAMTQRDRDSLVQLIHRMNLMLDLLSLQSLKESLKHCLMLLMEFEESSRSKAPSHEHAFDASSLEEAQKKVSVLIENVLNALNEHQNQVKHQQP